MTDFRNQTRAWPAMTQQALQVLSVNVMSEPSDPGARGGVPGRWMARVQFDLDPDECLVVTAGADRAHYFGIQLTDTWFSSLEYGNRQSSVTADQATTDPDGLIRFVIAHHDPGHPNWLDTCGLRTGTVLLRWDGCNGPLAEHAKPQCVRVRFDELATTLPPDSPRVSDDERRDAIARRRRHVQVRYGC